MTRCVNLVTSRVLDLAKAARPRVLDLAKAARDKKKADMSKRQPSSKETKAYTATVDDDVFYLFLQKQKIPY